MKQLHTLFGANTQVLILSSTIFLLAAGGSFWFFSHLSETATTYTQQLQLVADIQETEDVADEVRQVLRDSEDERAQLDQYFLNVVQIAQFLETVEQYAERNTISMNSQSLTTFEADGTGLATVLIPYEVYGSQTVIMDFLRMMESLPYHSQLQSVRMRSEGSELMRLDLEVVLSYTKHD